MKKLILLATCFGTLLIYLITNFNPFKQSVTTLKTIKGPVLIDRLHDFHFNVKLFYSDIALTQIEGYAVSDSEINPLTTQYASFTEGFIENDKNELLLNAVNQYRISQNLSAIEYYHNYEEVGNFGFLSLGEGLDSLYIINLSNYEVSLPRLDSDFALEPQYIYHINEGTDAYYLLTTQANGYKAYLYTLSKDDFSVQASRILSPPSKALTKQHYALDTQGNVYFTGSNSLIIVKPDETLNLPLDFDPDVVYYTHDLVYTFSLSELFLSYSIYDTEVGLTQLGQVNLPNKFVDLIHYEIKDSVLYTVTYDSSHPLYRNYVTLYDLKNNSILYCVALKDHGNTYFALLDASCD